MNRTIINKVRCMSISSGLPKSFWKEIMMIVAYIVNRCPSTTIEFKTPKERRSIKRPDYSQLQVFHCVTYVRQNKRKLEPKWQNCVFLWYPDRVKGYMMWVKDLKGYKTIISKDVIFDKDNMLCLSDKFTSLEKPLGKKTIQFKAVPCTQNTTKEMP